MSSIVYNVFRENVQDGGKKCLDDLEAMVARASNCRFWFLGTCSMHTSWDPSITFGTILPHCLNTGNPNYRTSAKQFLSTGLYLVLGPLMIFLM